MSWKHSLLAGYQFGYWKHNSTTDLLVYLDNPVQDRFNEGKRIVAILFELDKTINKTWRYNILKKLHDCLFRGNQMCIRDRKMGIKIKLFQI